jgi:hypothetical protein
VYKLGILAANLADDIVFRLNEKLGELYGQPKNPKVGEGFVTGNPNVNLDRSALKRCMLARRSG